ncbi:hypothetical protein [Actinomadura violacea]|uniref:Uncharacterized protein n=1 Tax=Actinomadura violacea TaxID=2819934 RepID=A0ABS3S0E8_9ACTN|nr:hypothetical protein [Actinomadura violacea]MBO2461740.1 hypothetical protein [Actinomadura violacea]
MATALDEATLAHLPTGVHATVLTAQDPRNLEVERIVVWGDPVSDLCPRCGEPIPDRGVPVYLNGKACDGGELVDRDLKHGCGEWLAQFAVLADEEDDVPGKADMVARARREELAEANGRIRRGLLRDLKNALERVADGEDPDDVTTGTNGTPGIYKDWLDGWLAWGDTADSEGVITVYAYDVQTAEDGGA